jgi:hypothetical protein
MAWVKAKEAMKAHGISCKKTLRRRRQSGEIKSRPVGDRYFEYWIGADTVAQVAQDEGMTDEWPEGWEDEILRAQDYESRKQAAMPEEDERYFYNEDTDRYVFHLRCLGGNAFAVERHIIEEVVQAYSSTGQNATVNEISRAQGWSRAVTKEILKRLGKTHDSLPLTDEQIDAGDEDELVQDVIRLKEQKIHVKAEKAIWRKTQQDAESWQRLDHQILRPLVAMNEAPKRPAMKVKAKKAADPFSCFIMPSDLHVGKKGWALETGSDYGIDITRARLISAMEDLTEKIARFGKPEKIITGCGSDFFHIDNYAGGTTRGTPQDTDGSCARIMHEGFYLWRDFVEMLRCIAPVEIHAMAGNHDLILSFALIHWCDAYWRNVDDVTVNVSPCARSYTSAGSTLVGISHSEDTKHKDLPGLMAIEAREEWGRANHQVWFTGHWHTDWTMESRGTKVHVVPSLSGTDRWHKRNGYVGNHKVLPAYILDHKNGEIAQLNGIPAV